MFTLREREFNEKCKYGQDVVLRIGEIRRGSRGICIHRKLNFAGKCGFIVN